MMRDLIVMYHSVVADELAPSDDWLHVAATRFTEQLTWLLRWFDPVDPETFLLPRRRLRRPRLLITFDDGYANNLAVAVPILRRIGAPALFFLSPGYFDKPWFWWDRLRVGLATVGKRPTAAEIASLKGLTPSAIEAQVTAKLSAAGTDPNPPPQEALRPMTWKEAVTLARTADCFVGNHAWQHEILTLLSTAELTEVIRRSQQALQTHLGVMPNWIAPPNGNWRTDQELALHQAGFVALATTQPGWVRMASSDSLLWRLPRLGIGAHDTPGSLTRRLITTCWRPPPVPTAAGR